VNNIFPGREPKISVAETFKRLLIYVWDNKEELKPLFDDENLDYELWTGLQTLGILNSKADEDTPFSREEIQEAEQVIDALLKRIKITFV
jgi:hypothetical protein